MAIELDMNTLPENPEELQKVFDQWEAGAEPAAITSKDIERPAADEDKGQPGNDPALRAAQKAEQESADNGAEAAGVATKDGKHIIPYSVLKSERDRAARAEQLAREAADRIAALEAQAQAGNQGANYGEDARTDPQMSNLGNLSDDDFEILKEDFPTVYKALMAGMATIQSLESKLHPVETSVRHAEAERARSVMESVQEAIDSVPKLAHIQTSNAEAFALAQQFDATLRDNPAWANRPMSERFSKVTEMVESAIGPIDLPVHQTSLSAGNLTKAAKAKAAQAALASRTNVPTSLSEFPAGQHAAQDEREAADQLTHQQLAEKFSRMSADEMDAYFRSL